MIKIKEKFVIDGNGKRVNVLLDEKDYRKMLREIEELESIRAYDAAKAASSESIPFNQAVSEIEARHSKILRRKN